jgi:hypothetical protein
MCTSAAAERPSFFFACCKSNLMTAGVTLGMHVQAMNNAMQGSVPGLRAAQWLPAVMKLPAAPYLRPQQQIPSDAQVCRSVSDTHVFTQGLNSYASIMFIGPVLPQSHGPWV